LSSDTLAAAAREEIGMPHRLREQDGQDSGGDLRHDGSGASLLDLATACTTGRNATIRSDLANFVSCPKEARHAS
jgi:hypothetical protein